MTTNELREIAPNIYEGISPAKGEVRRFILLPEVTEAEMLKGLEEMFGKDSTKNPWDATVHFAYDLTEKNETINGQTYQRCLANAEIRSMQERLRKFNDRVARFRSEQKQTEQPTEKRKLR